MGRFDSAIEVAYKLISRNGQRVVLRRFVPPDQSATATPWKPAESTAVDTPALAVFLPYKLADYKQQFAPDDAIRVGDLRALVAAKGLTIPPDINGVLVRDGAEMKIISIRPLNPNGQDIIFELQVRA